MKTTENDFGSLASRKKKKKRENKWEIGLCQRRQPILQLFYFLLYLFICFFPLFISFDLLLDSKLPSHINFMLFYIFFSLLCVYSLVQTKKYYSQMRHERNNCVREWVVDVVVHFAQFIFLCVVLTTPQRRLSHTNKFSVKWLHTTSA